MSQVAIRTDASTAIGLGHLNRCLVLAEALRSRGVEITFICRRANGFPEGMIENRGFTRLTPDLDPENNDERTDAEATRALLEGKELRPDWLIVDHYKLGREWEKSLRERAGKLMVIDDLENRPHECDLLLDQNFRPDNRNPAGRKLPAGCIVRLGPRYALLDRSFAAWREKLPACGRPDGWSDGEKPRLLICLGGSDPDNETARVLAGIIPLRDRLEVTVVVGAVNPHHLEIAHRAAKLKIAFRRGVDNLAELLATHDLAVGAGGISNWERCALGIPAIVVSIAENQQAPAAALGENGAILYLGRAGQFPASLYGDAVNLLVRSPWLARSLSDKSRALVDGRGAERIAELLAPLPIVLRPADKEDRERLREWRNHEKNRRFSFTTATIDPETHNRWFAHTLSYPGRILLIGELKGRPVGVLRYDLNREEALASIYLVPGEHGRGYGAPLLNAGSTWLERHHPEIRRIKAEILAANQPARKVFGEAGFEESFATFYRQQAENQK